MQRFENPNKGSRDQLWLHFLCLWLRNSDNRILCLAFLKCRPYADLYVFSQITPFPAQRHLKLDWDMDALRVDQIKQEVTHFVKVKILCTDAIKKDDILNVGISQMTDILHNVIRICFDSHSFENVPSDIEELLMDPAAFRAKYEAESNGASDPESSRELDEDDLKIRARLTKLKEAAEKQRIERSLLPARPPRPKRIFYGKKNKDRIIDRTLDPSDQDYADKWIKTVLDTPRNRYLAEHRAKHGADALLLDDEPKEDNSIKAIEFHQQGIPESSTNDGAKKPLVRKPHLRSEERADIYTFYLRFSSKYYKSWIYDLISKKYGISQHAFRHIVKEVEKKKSFEKGTPTGRSRKLNPEQEEEMINFMKTEVANGRILTTKEVSQRYNITRSMAHGYMVRHNVSNISELLILSFVTPFRLQIMRLSSKTKRILRLQAEGKEYTPWPAKYNKRKQERKRAIKAGLMPPPPEGRQSKKAKKDKHPPPPSEDSNGDLMAQNSQLDQGSLNASQATGLLRSDLLQGIEPDLQLSYNVQSGHIAHTSNASLSSLSALSNVNKSMSSVFPAFYSSGPSHGSQASMAWNSQMEMNNITNYNNLVSAQFPNQRDIIHHHQQQQQQYRPH